MEDDNLEELADRTVQALTSFHLDAFPGAEPGGDHTDIILPYCEDITRDHLRVLWSILGEWRAAHEKALKEEGDRGTAVMLVAPWRFLLQRGVSLRPLSAVLSTMMIREGPLAVLCARVYLQLLWLPGAAMKLFHPIVVQNCVSCLRHWDGGKSQQDDLPRSKKRKKEKHPKDEETEKDTHLLLKELHHWLCRFSLTMAREVKNTVIEVVFGLLERTTVESVVTVGYDTLRALCLPIHGNPRDVVQLMLQRCIPLLLVTAESTSGVSTCRKPALRMRHHALNFAKEMVARGDRRIMKMAASKKKKMMRRRKRKQEEEEEEEEEEAPISPSAIAPYNASESLGFALIQHVLVRVPERAGFRKLAAEVVCSLFTALPDPIEEVDQQFLTFMEKYAKNSRATYRTFTCEVIQFFLVERHSRPLEPAMVGRLLRMLLDRCSDRGHTVRARALTCCAEVIAAPGRADRIRSHGEEVVALLRRRVGDEKMGVRKASLAAMESLFGGALHMVPAADVIQRITERSNDRCKFWGKHNHSVPASLVRKQAIQCLTAVMLQHDVRDIHRAWMEALMPLCMDIEGSVADVAWKMLEEHVLQGMINAKEDDRVWSLLNEIQGDTAHYWMRVGERASRLERLKDEWIVSLQDRVHQGFHRGAWIVLTAFAPHMVSAMQMEMIQAGWKDVAEFCAIGSPRASDAALVLRVMTCGAESKQWDSHDMQRQLSQRLLALEVEPTLVGPMARCVLAMQSDNVQQVSRVFDKVLDKVEAQLAKWVQPLIQKDAEQAVLTIRAQEDTIVRLLFTFGEVSEVHPNDQCRPGLVSMVQTLVSPSLASKDQLPAKIRAHAFIALGKLCLQDAELAKQCLPALARELTTANAAAVRNNVMIVLCDLCVRYTALVDPYIPVLACRLGDPHPLIRKQTLTMLTKLIQEDFVKWKGRLFFRYVVAMVDQDESIRTFARYCLLQILLVKTPLLLIRHFVETVYHLNGHRGHPTYNQFQETDTERTLFSMQGGEHRQRRRDVYTVMMGEMSDDQRFELVRRLSTEVLAAVADGVIPVQGADGLLEDTLWIMASPHIKLTKKTVAEEEEEDLRTARAQKARGKVLTKIMKKNMVENVIPTIVDLKRLLEQHRSPLLGEVMRLLKEIVTDYREEVSDMMVADRVLAAEVEYDIRHVEKSHARPPTTPSSVTAVAIAAAASGTPLRKAQSEPIQGSSAHPLALARSPSQLSAPKLRRGVRGALQKAIKESKMVTPHKRPMEEETVSSREGKADVYAFSPEQPAKPQKKWKVTSPGQDRPKQRPKRGKKAKKKK